MSKKHNFIALVLLLMGSTAVHASLIRVSQEANAGMGDFVVLGDIATFTPTLATSTIADFYQYGSPADASYNGNLNGGPDPESSTTQSFFVEAFDGLHYVVVHDKPNDGSGGNAKMTTLLAGGGIGMGGATYSVEDGESSDVHSVMDDGPDREFITEHEWLACCTDGYAIGELELSSSFLMFAMFDLLPTGIDFWQATSSNGGGDIALDIDLGRSVRFSAVPIPAAVWLFGTALVGFVCISRRRKMG